MPTSSCTDAVNDGKTFIGSFAMGEGEVMDEWLACACPRGGACGNNTGEVLSSPGFHLRVAGSAGGEEGAPKRAFCWSFLCWCAAGFSNCKKSLQRGLVEKRMSTQERKEAEFFNHTSLAA